MKTQMHTHADSILTIDDLEAAPAERIGDGSWRITSRSAVESTTEARLPAEPAVLSVVAPVFNKEETLEVDL